MASKHTLSIMAFLVLFGIGRNALAERLEADVRVCKNQTVTLLCCTDEFKSTYRWRFPSRKPIPHKTDKYEQIDYGAKLLVKNVDKSDAALKFISCHTSSKDMRKVVYLYRIIIDCQDIKSSVGSSLTLPCQVNVPDNEIDYVKWMFIFKKNSKSKKLFLVKKDGKITQDSFLIFGGRISTSNRSLTINDIKMEDIGTYRCIAYRKKNVHLSNPKYSYHLNVTAKTTVKPITLNTTASTLAIKTVGPKETITLSPNTGYTVSPNASESSTNLVLQSTTASTQSTRKMLNVTIRSTMASIKPTKATVSTIHLNTGKDSVQLTWLTSSKTIQAILPTVSTIHLNTGKDSVQLTWLTSSKTIQAILPTAASVSFASDSLKQFTTKEKDAWPTTVSKTNFNKTQKLDVETPNGSSTSSLSCWQLVMFCYLISTFQINSVWH